MSQYLFSSWEKASRPLSEGRALLLFDFDGTLAPLVRRPASAHLEPHVRRLVRAVTHHANFTVGVLSGRGLDQLRRKMALPGLLLSGNHGLEINGLGARFVHPQARAHARALRNLA